MSDLYLVLRHRLASVPDWVFIESAVLRQARERQGLSYEAMGRQLNVASKTYERYEKAGRLPPQLVRRVAELLDIEIEEPERVRVTATRQEENGPIEVRLSSIERKLDQLDRKLDLIDVTGALAGLREEMRGLALSLRSEA